MGPNYYCVGCGQQTLRIIERVESEDELKDICTCDRCGNMVHIFLAKDYPPEEAYDYPNPDEAPKREEERDPPQSEGEAMERIMEDYTKQQMELETAYP